MKKKEIRELPGIFESIVIAVEKMKWSNHFPDVGKIVER